MITKCLFSVLFIIVGVVLLLTRHGLAIRGTGVNFGWLVLGIGVVSLAWDAWKARRARNPTAVPSKKD